MGKLYVIRCSDCGWPRVTARKNTKYCYVCRTLKNLIFMHGKTFKCVGCENVLAPIDRNQDLCCECNPYLQGSVIGDCALCAKENVRLLGDTVRVCDVCACDPKQRGQFKKRLLDKQKAIKAGEITMPTEEDLMPEGFTNAETPDVVPTVCPI